MCFLSFCVFSPPKSPVHSTFFFFWSELATVVHERPRRPVDGLARRKGHLTTVIPIHGRIIQPNPLRLEHLSYRVKILLLLRRRRRRIGPKMPQVVPRGRRLVQIPRRQPPLMVMMMVVMMPFATGRIQITVRQRASRGGPSCVIWQRFVHGPVTSSARVQAHGLHVTMIRGARGGRRRVLVALGAAVHGRLLGRGVVEGQLGGRSGRRRHQVC